MKKLSFDTIINKIWNQGISKWYKSKKFWLCMGPISILTTVAITTTTYFVVDKKKEKPLMPLTQVETPDDIIYHKPQPSVMNPEVLFYNIDGKNFSSYSKAFDYFKKQLKKETNSYNLTRYTFGGEEYATQNKLYDAFKKRFAINKIRSLKNPFKNIINNGNEVSRNAITTSVENFRKIYRGKDGSSYTNYDDALKTYMNYDQKYTVENLPFESKSEALYYLQRTKQEQLDLQIKDLQGKSETEQEEIMKKQGTECYLQQGGYCQTREEIYAWLEKNTKVGFEYKGKVFSDYNYEEFEKEFKQLDSDIIERNIIPVDNADLNSFWIEHPSDKPGFFVGPKYVETTTAENSLKGNSSNWETVDSFTPSLFLAPLTLNAFGTMTNIASEIGEEFNLENFLNIKSGEKNSYRDLNTIVSFHAHKSLKEFESTFPRTKGMSSFEKTLVILKRVLNYLYTTDTFDDNSGNSPDEILKKEFKSLIKKILTNGVMKELYNSSFIDKETGIDYFDHLSFDTIYSIFLNPGKFMETNDDKQDILKLANNIQNTINDIMGMADNVEKFTSTMKDTFNPKSEKNQESAVSIESSEMTHYQKETVEYHQKLTHKVTEEIEKQHPDGSKSFIKTIIEKETELKEKRENISIDTHKHTTISARGGSSSSSILSAVSKAWELTNMLSFVSIQTKRMKIDDNQYLYYSEPTFRVPIIGYEFPIKDPNVDITKLVESPLTQLIGSNVGSDGEKLKVWKLASNYYLKKENAEKDLKMMIYKNPKKYLGARTIETNIMDKYFYYYIDTDEITEERKKISPTDTKVNVNDLNNSDKEIQETMKVNNARKKFIEEIIKKHFIPNRLHVYLDGFGEAFSDPFSAKDNLLKKLQDASKTDIKNYYSFRLDNGDEIIANSKAEMEKKIRENVVVPSKTIISSDLFRNSMFDSLQDNPDQSGYDVYELEFYGEKLYFPTYYDAWNYVVNHSKYEKHVVNVRNITYTWKDEVFNSTDQYYDQFTKNVKVRKNLKSEVKFYD